ncbi:MAG: DUF502 domain-containing protein [Bacteroidetes bacterium]|nr:DUF502 domain-containing protein [Bacteroidota bacterium]
MEHRKFASALLGYFFQGLLFLAPISITIYIIYIAFVYVDGLLTQYIKSLLGFTIPGLGLLIILVSITLIGFLGSSFIFKPLAGLVERFITKAPLIKIIYTSIKDLLEAFVGKKKRFNEPVLVTISQNSNLQKIGFVTNNDLSILGLEDKYVAVYLPHSYAWSGNLFIVPAEHVKPLDTNPAEVMKFIISAGVTNI